MQGVWFSSLYVVSIDTGHIAQSPQLAPRWSLAFKMEPVLFPPSISYRTLGLHFCISDVDIFSCDYFKGCELNLLLEIGFNNACLVLKSFPMTTPKAFLHALGGQVFFTLWNENISCHINKQKCHSHQRYLASSCEWGLPKLRSRGCSHPPTPQMAEDAAIPPTPQVIAEEWGECKEQGELGNKIGPDSWSAWEKNECSEPRGLHLPIHRMLNSLTGYLIFAV